MPEAERFAAIAAMLAEPEAIPNHGKGCPMATSSKYERHVEARQQTLDALDRNNEPAIRTTQRDFDYELRQLDRWERRPAAEKKNMANARDACEPTHWLGPITIGASLRLRLLGHLLDLAFRYAEAGSPWERRELADQFDATACLLVEEAIR